ncbi:hypothetical protein [Nannocystis pusilla]|uniref:hypothetical protein n=1 Tax=Nannocystis pusilla TaxID=889268 RepID=UPI003B7707D1
MLAAAPLGGCSPPDGGDTSATTTANASTGATNSAQTTNEPTTADGPTTADPTSSTTTGVMPGTSSSTSLDTTTTETSTSTTSTTTDASSTSTSTTTDASSTSSTVSTSGEKLDLPAPPACDVIEQDCPIGQKCTPYASDMGPEWDSTKCVDVVDDAGIPGQPCTVTGSPTSGIDTCDATSMCWNVDPDTLKGECFPFCVDVRGQNGCKKIDPQCVIVDDALPLCFEQCQPEYNPCGAGEVCVPQLQQWYLQFVCVPDQSGAGGQEFSPCTKFNTCDPGFICMEPQQGAECDQDAEGCCLSLCDTAGPMCNGVNQECTAWFEFPPPGFEDVGVCIIPQ